MSRMLLIVYATTIFLTASLLFVVQPMFAKMVLPLLGGSPAVWNTCLVFYQAALLAGYLYAHATTSWLGVRRQAALHVGLVLLPLLFLPIGVPSGWTPPAAASPIPWLLALLAVAVGLPFFVVSTTSPLLQKWFAATGHPAAGDPYFLYAASNLGSMLGLLGYPVLLEPRLRLSEQSRLWSGGYLLLLAFTLACAVLLWRSPVPALADPSRGRSIGVTARRRLRWVLLALVPSSLMLSVTTFISADVEAIPLLWVIPLAIYLLTFVLVFARRPLVPHALVVRVLPIALLALVVVLVKRANQPLLLVMGLHLAVFFVTAMVCYGELARDRAPPAPLRARDRRDPCRGHALYRRAGASGRHPPELLRRESRDARREEGASSAHPRQHAARCAEPRARTAPRAPGLLPSERPDRAGVRGARRPAVGRARRPRRRCARLLCAAARRVGLLRDRSPGRAHRPRSALLHLPPGLLTGCARRARRRAPVAGAGGATLRSHRPRRLQLGRDPRPPPHARSAADVSGPPRSRRGARLPHLQPAPRPRAGARRSGARCGRRRAHPGRRRDPGRARGGEAPVALGGHGAPPGRPRQPGGRRALDAAPGARGRAGVDRRLLERARRAALALISAEARRALREARLHRRAPGPARHPSRRGRAMLRSLSDVALSSTDAPRAPEAVLLLLREVSGRGAEAHRRADRLHLRRVHRPVQRHHRRGGCAARYRQRGFLPQAR